MPNPILTWERSAIAIVTTGGNPVELAAAVATLVTASTDWRVIDGGDGVTDDYVEIGGAVGGAAENARILLGFNPAALTAEPANANKGFEQATGTTANVWACYAPDDGRTANPWEGAGAVYSNRNTGYMRVAPVSITLDRVRMVSSEEALCILFGLNTGTQWYGCIAGACIVPPRESAGESDGRVRGLFTNSGNAIQSWSSPAFSDTGTTIINNKAAVFDPNAPNTQMPAVNMWFPLTFTSQTGNTVDGAELHTPVVWMNRQITSSVAGGQATPGANASPFSSKVPITVFSGALGLGVWRQIRAGKDRVDGIDVEGPPPTVVSLTVGASTVAAADTLYFDNDN